MEKETKELIDKKTIESIEKTIGYIFDNKKLLEQAFIRRSYGEEHDIANNEVLEFFGDTVLDQIVIKKLKEKYGKVKKYYETKYKESFFTILKSKIVKKENLSKEITKLELNKYIIETNDDIKENISVKEDLFEAIIGAIWIDSNYNYEKIETTVDKMIPNFKDLIKTTEKSFEMKNRDAILNYLKSDSNKNKSAFVKLKELQDKSLINKVSYKNEYINNKWNSKCIINDYYESEIFLDNKMNGANELAASNAIDYIKEVCNNEEI